MNITKVAVVGAGTMGSGIAQVCACAGLNVVLQDINAAALVRAVQSIESSLKRLLDKQKLSETEVKDALSRIVTTTELADFANADVVIEAATEAQSLKLKILAQLSEVVGDNAVIATNTSSLSVTELAAATKRPEQFIGLHFFNPVPMMALVEVIAGLQTSEQTQARATDFVALINKTGINAKNSAGFAVNRILVPMLNEAIFALQEGLASAEDIDLGMKLGCGHPIGPLALADLIGLDTLLAIIESFYQSFSDPKYRPAPLLREMVHAGYLGRKSGRGFFSYGTA